MCEQKTALEVYEETARTATEVIECMGCWQQLEWIPESPVWEDEDFVSDEEEKDYYIVDVDEAEDM